MNYKLPISLMAVLSISSAAQAQDDLRPYIIQSVQAEAATSYSNAIRVEEDYLSNISSGDWFSIQTGDLEVGTDSIMMNYAQGGSINATVEIRKDSLSGPIIASGLVPSTGSWGRFLDANYLINGLTDSKELFFIFNSNASASEGAIGTIDEIKFTRSQRNVLEAENHFNAFGVSIAENSVAEVGSGDWLQFKDVRLGNGFSNISLHYRKKNFLPFNVTFHLDNLEGPIIGTLDLPRTGNMTSIIETTLEANEGTHDIFAKFSGIGRLSMLDYISLEEQPLATKLVLAKANIARGVSYFDDQKYVKLEPSEDYHWFRFNNTSVSYNPKFEFEYARESDLPMRIEMRRNRISGRLMGTIDLPSTGSLDNYETVSAYVQDIPQGIYHLVFNLVGEGDVHIGDIELTRIGDDSAQFSNDDQKPVLGELALDNVIIDQFGYRPEMAKVAILRDGEIGLGSSETDYIPGNAISLVDAATNEIVFADFSKAFRNGAIDSLSGDRVWTFDFSEINTAGTYYIYDEANNARSVNFDINANIYENVLRETFRTFVYQRSGFEKTANIVGENYADSASHTGPFQDTGARLFNDRRRRSTTRNLSGGWYDAGDFNKYSNWTADYILGLLHAYHANPAAWRDDWNLPDSGNGIPDILDEVRWGVEHLQRMQETASETNAANVGAVLSVLESDDSLNRPSENFQDSFYGPPSSSATFNSAGALAYAASTFADLPDQSFQTLAESLSESAISAYDWAERNPNVKFNNADNGVGAGNSEVTQDYFLDAKRRIGAIYLYGLTQDRKYKNFIESDYRNTRLIKLLWASPYESEEQTALLHYASLSGINPAVGSEINNRFNNIMEHAGNARPALEESAYRSFIQEYVWGSNRFVSRKGGMFGQLVSYDLSARPERENLDAAAGYLHYIHGVNPLGKVYLSNMNNLGAERSVDEFYHVWFADGTEWDNVNSSFGPPPGYLVGGANQFYSGGLDVNQPPMKSYVETNSFLNNEQCWQFTENSNGYQIEYLRLLSQFVK